MVFPEGTWPKHADLVEVTVDEVVRLVAPVPEFSEILVVDVPPSTLLRTDADAAEPVMTLELSSLAVPFVIDAVPRSHPGEAGLQLVVPPGAYRVRATAASGRRLEREVRLEPGRFAVRISDADALEVVDAQEARPAEGRK